MRYFNLFVCFFKGSYRRQNADVETKYAFYMYQLKKIESIKICVFSSLVLNILESIYDNFLVVCQAIVTLTQAGVEHRMMSLISATICLPFSD